MFKITQNQDLESTIHKILLSRYTTAVALKMHKSQTKILLQCKPDSVFTMYIVQTS